MSTTPSSELSDGPVLSLINKRIRALRKKLNRIIQMEDSISQGKTINNEQEEVLRSKASVLTLIEELEKLHQPLSSALSEELNLAVQKHQEINASLTKNAEEKNFDQKEEDRRVEDLLRLLYFSSLFDVKSQGDFISTMLTRTHERGCCLTYDYVTDDDTELLGERDLDLISKLGGMLISRPVDSSLSHKNALERCVERAKLWIARADQSIETNSDVTYAGLRERLNKIMASDYFTTTPEMKAPVEVAAAAASGTFANFQVPVQVDAADSGAQFTEMDDDAAKFQESESAYQPSPVKEFHKDDIATKTPSEVIINQQGEVKPDSELDQNQRDIIDSEEQRYIPRRTYPNQRGGHSDNGGGGHRGYSNGRGGRVGGGGGGSYQNGRYQYYKQPENYHPRNYYNNRGRGGRGDAGYSYNNNNHSPAVHGGHTSASGDISS